MQKAKNKLTNLGRVVGGAKDEFRGTVVPGTDVRDVRLVLHEDLGAAEITELQDTGGRVKEQVLRLDVPVANALGVDVRQRAEELVDIKLNFENGHNSFHLVKISGSSVDSLGDIFENEVEVDFVFL